MSEHNVSKLRKCKKCGYEAVIDARSLKLHDRSGCKLRIFAAVEGEDYILKPGSSITRFMRGRKSA